MKTLTEIQDLLAGTLVTQEDKRKQAPEPAPSAEPSPAAEAPQLKE